MTPFFYPQAAVTVSFEQVGNDVVATWSGSIDLGEWQNDGVWPPGTMMATPTMLVALDGAVEGYRGATAVSLDGFGGTITSFTGSYGLVDRGFWAAGIDDNEAPESTLYDFGALGVSQTFGDQTLTEIGASAFNNTLAWTSSELGTNTISYTTVPEPSSIALIIGLGALALAVRRRR